MLHKAALHRKHRTGQTLMGWLASDVVELATDGYKNVGGELNVKTYHHFLRLERITRCFCWLTRFFHRCRIHLIWMLLSLWIVFIADFQLSEFCWFSFLHWTSTSSADFIIIITTRFESSDLNINNVNDRFFYDLWKNNSLLFPCYCGDQPGMFLARGTKVPSNILQAY
jgi:hypothetical protein